MEWKLFDPQNPPPVANPDFLRNQGWMRLAGQPGFRERSTMVREMVADVLRWCGPYVHRVTDLGCGDGAMLRVLADDLAKAGILRHNITGYDIGASDIAYANKTGPFEFRLANIHRDLSILTLGQMNIMTEVLEHMTDPHGFLLELGEILRDSPGQTFLLATSPGSETDEWHNDIHLWAWDWEGYAQMFFAAGWEIVDHVSVGGGENNFNGVTRAQTFQGITAVIR
jgi:SAM-dependent methyltransferase